MTQPSFAPIALEDEVRPSYRLEPPAPWRASRPADLPPGVRAGVIGGGVPGPDQGYALHLASRFRDRLVLLPGEHAEDVIAGALTLALRRAALYGRAPVASDLELALTVFGYLGDAPGDLVEHRRPLFAGAAHDYSRQRALSEALPDETLRSNPAAVRSTDWRRLVELT
ncbi:MAG: hypothetical protein ACYCXY_01685 [Acidimicrobiales bacterium]